jgi:hypothetical protein
MVGETVDLRSELPVVARHEGVWEGRFVEIDTDLSVVDRFETRISVDLSPDGEWSYRQRNRYRWPDGTEATHDLPGTYEDGRIVFDTDYVQGEAWEATHDDRSVVLTWTRPEEPSVSYHEIITINAADDSRARTWHWFDEDGLMKRTLIEEERVE